MSHLLCFTSMTAGLGVLALVTNTPFDTNALLWIGFALFIHRYVFEE